ncbi:MAG: hypothetical protein HQL07_07470 [Nitrospirae bacterium]|nr:hypothetical protein [Magnetococcales bacterium]HAT49029.1 hypothetical protein [Alphaproteobacteria bacterium]
MTDSKETLTEWFSKQPNWLRFAAFRLHERDTFDDSDIEALAKRCLQEAVGTPILEECSFPESSFSQKQQGSLYLTSISNIENVNALSPTKPLAFRKDKITLIYGLNGSGKSSYVRLLKHICGARNTATIHHNIYKSIPGTQKAELSYEQDNKHKNLLWTGQGSIDDLKAVDIFDASYGQIFVDNGGEARYEPAVLSFLGGLVTTCDRVKSVLEAKLNNCVIDKQSCPPETKDTEEIRWYMNITAATSKEDIEKKCTFSAADATNMESLQHRLSEKNPSERVSQLEKQKGYGDGLLKDAQTLSEQLSDEIFQQVVAANKDVILKKKFAKDNADQVFSSSHFKDIGSNIWKELWKAARKFSIESAYKGLDYPNVADNSRCIYCHQVLDQEAKDRLHAFDNFVNGEMQRVADEAENKYKTLIRPKTIPSNAELVAKIDAAGIESADIKSQICEFFSQLHARNDLLQRIESECEFPAAFQKQQWFDDIKLRSICLSDLAKKSAEDAKNKDTISIQQALNSILAKKWLSGIREKIESEAERLKERKHIEAAIKKTKTNSLTKKISELYEVLITQDFVKRFNDELNALGAAQLNIEMIRKKATKGRVLHGLQLRLHHTSDKCRLIDVLSEGEHRIVSIAAFLADSNVQNSKSPFIFDDPISSLDQTYEEAVVNRIYKLSEKRQVIIFTHRLSLVGLVQECAKVDSLKPEIVYIRGIGEGKVGEPSDTPLSAQNTKKTLNILINERLPKAKKIFTDQEGSDYESSAKALCSEFRILLERMIESNLMADVVQRHRRAINTMGKIKELAKINADDCKFFDDKMTKYSRYEHSQSQEAPVHLPGPEEIEKDLNELQTWLADFTKRPTPTSKSQ